MGEEEAGAEAPMDSVGLCAGVETPASLRVKLFGGEIGVKRGVEVGT